MKKVLTLLAIVLLFTACNRCITPTQAANGKAKCGKYLK